MGLSEQQGLFGKVANVVDTVTKVHGLAQAARAARPYVAAGVRFASSFL